MTTIILICLILLASLSCFLSWKIYFMQKDISNKNQELDEHIEITNSSINDIYKILNEQREYNKSIGKWNAQVDVALIRLIDVPYLTNELDPGYAKTWSGIVPYPLNKIFIGSEIKINDYVYKIDEIEDNRISISRT